MALGIDFIESVQKNRRPMLFLDQVISVENGSSAHCRKAFSYGEWFFENHFPSNPIVPGFVLLEAMTQSLLIAMLSDSNLRGKETAFLEVINTVFIKEVLPGDVIDFHAEVDSYRRGIFEGSVVATRAGGDVANSRLKLGIPSELVKLTPRSERR